MRNRWNRTLFFGACFALIVASAAAQTDGQKTFSHLTYNVGGGITFDLNRLHRAKLYAEFRIHKPYFSDSEMGAWPITIGLRW